MIYNDCSPTFESILKSFLSNFLFQGVEATTRYDIPPGSRLEHTKKSLSYNFVEMSHGRHPFFLLGETIPFSSVNHDLCMVIPGSFKSFFRL